MYRHIIRLINLKYGLMAGFSAFAGGILFNRHINILHLYGVCGAVFLAFGCFSLNQYQERENDAHMQHTSKRPLPSGNLLPEEGLKFSFIMFMLSLCFLFLTESICAIFIFALTVGFYNFIYTPAKRKTPFSVVIGSFAGSLSVMLGFCAAGGTPASKNALIFAGLHFFWLMSVISYLNEKYAAESRNAGFVTPVSAYGEKIAGRLTSFWTTAYLCMLLVFPLVGIYRTDAASFIHMFFSAMLCLLIFFTHEKKFLRFGYVSISLLFLLIFIISDSMFSN